MADETIQVRITLLDEVSNEVKAMRANMEAQFAATKNAADKTKSSFDELKKSIIAMVSVGAVFTYFKNAAEAANQQAIIQGKLTNALGFTSKALLAQADALKYKSLYDDDDILAADALLAGYVKNESQIKKLIPAVMDLATAQGLDLATTARLVAKGFSDDTGELGRFKIAVQGSAGSAERLDSIVAGLGKNFGGQASAAYEASNGTDTFAKAADDFNKGAGSVLNETIKELSSSLVSVGADFGSFGKTFADGVLLPFRLATELSLQVTKGFALIGYGYNSFMSATSFGKAKADFKQIADENKRYADALGEEIDVIKNKIYGIESPVQKTVSTAIVKTTATGSASTNKSDTSGHLKLQWGESFDIGAMQKRNEEAQKQDVQRKIDASKLYEETMSEMLNSTNEGFKKRKEIRDKETQETINAERLKQQAQYQTATMFGDTLVMIGKAAKADAGTQKALATVQAIINTSVGVTRMLGGAPPPFNFAMAAMVAAQGAAQIAMINQQKFATGGRAQPGYAMVGEQGPELVRFNSGAQVYNNRRTQEITNNQGVTVHLYDNSGNLSETLRGQLRSGHADALINDIRRKVAA